MYMKNWKLQGGTIDANTLPTLSVMDVVVIGGGPSGVAAATTAGKAGLKTLLIEKYGFCGGSAVAGMSATICGLYKTQTPENRMNTPEQIVFGFTERFRQTMLKNGGLTQPQLYGNTYVDTHEARVWKVSADELLTNANVEILFHTAVVDVILDDDALTGVVVSTASGLGAIYAKRFIDSSGDGMVAALSGVPFACGEQGNVQNPTIIFKLSNVNTKVFWDYYGKDTICHDDLSDLLRKAETDEGKDLPRKKIWVFQGVNSGEIFINATAIHHVTEQLIMTNPEHFTYAERMARKQMQDYATVFFNHVPGCADAYIGEVASEVGVRQTRSIQGQYCLTNEDVEQCRRFEDGIVKSSWPIELHKGEAPKLHWLFDDYYEVPFRTLQPVGVENLLVAGRCLCAEHEALASARVTAQCFAYGEAAAVGAILSLEKPCKTSQINGIDVRNKLENNHIGV